MPDHTETGQIQLACVGTGALAEALVLTLVERGMGVRACLRTPGGRRAARAAGAPVHASPTEAAAGCGIVLSLHDDAGAARQAALGASGLVAGLSAEATWVEMTTLDPGTATYFACAAAGAGARFVDAPLLAGSGSAGSEDLPVVLAGGDPADVGRITPVLEAVGCRVLYAGPVGSGCTLLAAVAAVTGPLEVAIREARALLSAGPVELDRLRAALLLRGVGAPALDALAGDEHPLPSPEGRRSACRATRRALALALEIADGQDLSLPVAAVTREVLGRGLPRPAPGAGAAASPG
ncbi:NAD(P)-binding domain-containing protein [Myxococcota bacterium]|nr:NAD(P)-binding domain-containing protein [Myxococcota bacterium]